MCFTKLWLAIHSAILGFAFQQTIREKNLAPINFFFHSSAILWFAFQQTIREKNLAPINFFFHSSAILWFAFQQTIREKNLAPINFFFHSSAILWFAFQQTIREKNLAPINIIPAFLVVFFPKSLLRNKSEPKEYGKVSVQPHTIAKQICFPNGNVLFLSLFSLFKNWMHNVV